MSGDAIRRRDNKQIRIHMCASEPCTVRHNKYANLYGVGARTEHVRFIAWLPPEEAASAAEEATPAVAEPGSANAGETGVKGTQVVAEIPTSLSEEVDEVSSLPVPVAPSDPPRGEAGSY